jgi:PHD/YefM family antitoxin component YafN of YafNO toxin-antitoxin module
MTITANQVKQRGVSVFDEILEKFDQFVITLRGKKKYVVMDIERYKELRAKELDMAYLGVMEDVKNGDYKVLSVEEHLNELKLDLKDNV